LVAALSFSIASGHVGFTVVQPHYNLVHRAAYESKLRDICATNGLACVPYRALAAGVLGGADGRIPTLAQRRTRTGYLARMPAALSSCLQRVAAATGSPPASIAFRWLLAQPNVVAPVFGTASPTHVHEILDAAAMPLPSELVEELSAASISRDPRR
jgi:aryl-alcohol dehydrogenase-like predicted oxidoreductase